MLVEVLGGYSNSTKTLQVLKDLLSPSVNQVHYQVKRYPLQQQRRLDKLEQQALVALYEDGKPVFELAEQFGVNRNTVSKIVARHGVELRCRSLSPENVTVASQLYQEGWSLARIAEQFKLSVGAIQNAFRRAGLKTRPVGTNQWG